MPILKESEFKKHISSKQYSNLYFIDGEEKMLVGTYTDILVKKLMGDNPPEFTCLITIVIYQTFLLHAT